MGTRSLTLLLLLCTIPENQRGCEGRDEDYHSVREFEYEEEKEGRQKGNENKNT